MFIVYKLRGIVGGGEPLIYNSRIEKDKQTLVQIVE